MFGFLFLNLYIPSILLVLLFCWKFHLIFCDNSFSINQNYIKCAFYADGRQTRHYVHHLIVLEKTCWCDENSKVVQLMLCGKSAIKIKCYLYPHLIASIFRSNSKNYLTLLGQPSDHNDSNWTLNQVDTNDTTSTINI